MFDRTACHLVLDSVLDELEAGENFVDFRLSPHRLQVLGQAGEFDPGRSFEVDETYYPHSEFTRRTAINIMWELQDMGLMDTETDTTEDQ